ncbi:ABC transporter permease [Sciscionella sediminilitoris]|uniref:ABC transporter permease n=1 Tax=Sciscionella sediminilitoris TaxID=1445613 RepID=UPI0004DF4383|nr:ABC transporter permease [Sciscionella sp. SE31]
MLRDAALMFKRDARLGLRSPAWIGVSLMQPLLYLLFFGPLMEKIVASTPGFPPGNAWQILVPALVVQLGLFASSFAGFGILADIRTGTLERFRVTPASRAGLLLGKVGYNIAQLLVQAALIIVVAVLFFGLRAPFGGIVLTLVLAAFLGATLASASYALALVIRNEQAFPAMLQTVLMPLFLLSGVMIPITTGLAPNWLYIISRINPFSYVMEAERAAFRAATDGLFTGIIVLAVLTVLAVWWGTRTFQKENA